MGWDKEELNTQADTFKDQQEVLKNLRALGNPKFVLTKDIICAHIAAGVENPKLADALELANTILKEFNYADV